MGKNKSFFNLSKFKKVASDAKTTTLRHPDGHSFTIAHNAVSPEVRKQLKELEMHGDSKKQSNPKLEESKKLPHYADGTGDVKPKDDVPNPDPKKAADFEKGFNSSGVPSPSGAWQNIKSGLGFADGGNVDTEAVADAALDRRPPAPVRSQAQQEAELDYPPAAKQPPLSPELAAIGPQPTTLLPGESQAMFRGRREAWDQAYQRATVPNYDQFYGVEFTGKPYAPPAPKETHQEKMQGLQKGAGYADGGSIKPHYADGTGDVSSSSTQDTPDQIVQDASTQQPQQQDVQLSPELQAKRAAYNNQVQTMSVIPGDPDEQQRIKTQQFGPNGEPPANFNTIAWNDAQNKYQDAQKAEMAVKQAATDKIKQDNVAKMAAGLSPTPITSDNAASGAPDVSTPPGAPDNSPTVPEGSGAVAPSPGDKELAQLQARNSAVNSAIPGRQNAPAAPIAPGKPGSNPQDTMKVVQASHQMSYDALMKERKGVFDKLANTDATAPSIGKMFSDASFLGKIGMVASLLAGGRVSLAIYQGMVDSELNAQKQNLGKNENLLANNLATMGNIKDAVALSKININDQVMHKMVQLAQKYPNNPQIQQNLQSLGMIGAQSSSNLMDNVAANQAWRHMAEHITDPTQHIQFNPLLSPEQKNSALKELGTFENMNTMRTNMLSAFDKVNSMSPAYRIAHPAEVDALVEPLLAQSVKDSEGRITPQDVPMIRAIVKPSMLPKSITGKTTTTTQREQLAKFMSSKMNFPYLQLAGVNTATPPVGQIQTGPPKLGK